MVAENIAYSNRTHDFTVQLKTPSGGYAQLAATDVVRCKIGRGTGVPSLDLDTVAATANSSSVTVAELGDGSATHASVTIRLAQADLSSLQGAYDIEVSVVDDSETAPADAIKAVGYDVLVVIATMGGDIGKT